MEGVEEMTVAKKLTKPSPHLLRFPNPSGKPSC